MYNNDKVTIALPESKEFEAYREVIQNEFKVETPQFDGIKRAVTTAEANFLFLKPCNVGDAVWRELADIGIVGTEIAVEYAALDIANIGGINNRLMVNRAESAAEPLRRFSVLAVKGPWEDEIKAAVECNPSWIVALVTAYPKLLSVVSSLQKMPFTDYAAMSIDDNVETYPRALRLSGAAGVVITGETAQRNRLIEVLKLWDIWPEIITRKS